jgi:cysteine desulfurase family protein
MEKVIETQELTAELFNISKPQNIAFMPNATYALNAAILGSAGKGEHIVVTQMEHNSVLRPVYRLGNFDVAEADAEGFVSVESVRAAMRPDTRLVVCTHASNVCGTIEPVEEICREAHKEGALFLLDASQTAGCVDIDEEKIDADFIAFPGHKGLMGPLGTGGLYVKDPTTLEAVITGGTGSFSESLEQPRIMPDMLHSGTINTAAVAALGKGVKFILKHGAAEIGRHERELAAELEEGLRRIGGIRIYGAKHRVGITAFNSGGRASSETEELLGGKIAVRSGYHCAPLAHAALGTADTGAVRVSFGAFDTRRSAKRMVRAVEGIV